MPQCKGYTQEVKKSMDYWHVVCVFVSQQYDVVRPFVSQQRTLVTEGTAANWTCKLATARELVSHQISCILKRHVALLTDMWLVVDMNNLV